MESVAKPLKVLHVIASVDPASGGPIEGLLRISRALALEQDREVVSFDRPEADYLRDIPIRVHAVGRAPGRLTRWLPRQLRGYSPTFRPWLNANLDRFDVVVVEGLWNHATHGASLALRRRQVPYFVFTHGMLDPWFRRRYPVKHLLKQLSWQLFEGPLLAGARSVLFTTETERRLAVGQFPGFPFACEVVGYGTEAPPTSSAAQEIAFRLAVPGLGERPYLLFLSRLHEKKGIDLLVKAFARLAAEYPDLDLVIAGPGEPAMVATLNALIARTGLSQRVHMPGMIRGDAKWGALYGCEAFVLASHQENFGVVVAEALACGRPVLISDQVNICEEVSQARAGIVDSDTVEGAERMMREYLALPEAQRQAMASAARGLFETSFDVNATARRLADVLSTVRQPG